MNVDISWSEFFLRQIRDRVDWFTVFFHGEVQVTAFFAVINGRSCDIAYDGTFGDGIAFSRDPLQITSNLPSSLKAFKEVAISVT